MSCIDCNTASEQTQNLRSDQIAVWFETDWVPPRSDQSWVTVWTQEEIAHGRAMRKLDRTQQFAGYRLVDIDPVECPIVNVMEELDHRGLVAQNIGAFRYRFQDVEHGDTIEALAVVRQYSERSDYVVAMACIPESFRVAWAAFENECYRVTYAREPQARVEVIGGNQRDFVPTVDWDEIILPGGLKQDILNDVHSFFTKGVDVYTRLNLKPFRKLLLAGVPGTGKTMLCNALAKWALEQQYLVVYVSSARKGQGDQYGSTFTKIQHALNVASYSAFPAIIILEELDAYLHDEEKALILNVLDGSESAINPYGTLLISTTNYPEAIDERVLKRPGRLDRIFIIPQVKRPIDAEAMLRRYLGVMWQDAHVALVPQLVGYPGAFIREVAIHALTRVAYDDSSVLSVEMLQASFVALKEQLDARDAFLAGRFDAENEDESEAEPALANGQHE